MNMVVIKYNSDHAERSQKNIHLTSSYNISENSNVKQQCDVCRKVIFLYLCEAVLWLFCITWWARTIVKYLNAIQWYNDSLEKCSNIDVILNFQHPNQMCIMDRNKTTLFRIQRPWCKTAELWLKYNPESIYAVCNVIILKLRQNQVQFTVYFMLL
jgi:hypothetical protein